MPPHPSGVRSAARLRGRQGIRCLRSPTGTHRCPRPNLSGLRLDFFDRIGLVRRVGTPLGKVSEAQKRVPVLGLDRGASEDRKLNVLVSSDGWSRPGPYVAVAFLIERLSRAIQKVERLAASADRAATPCRKPITSLRSLPIRTPDERSRVGKQSRVFCVFAGP